MRLLLLRVKTFWARAAPFATKIQALYRGHRARQAFATELVALEEKRSKIRKHFFYDRRAAKIQAAFRSYLARKGYMRLRAAAFVLQCLLRMLIWRRWFKKTGSSTSVVQRHWRKWWLKQTERMAEEGSAFTFPADGTADETKDFVPGPLAAPMDESKNAGGILIGKVLALGFQGKESSRLAGLRSGLDKVHFSSESNLILPQAIALGDRRSLLLCDYIRDKPRNKADGVQQNTSSHKERSFVTVAPQSKNDSSKNPNSNPSPTTLDEGPTSMVLQFGPKSIDWDPLRFIGSLRGGSPVEVCCGTDHCVVRLDTGAVFTWGSNSHGQLGVATKSTVKEPIPLDIASASSSRCISIAAHRDGSGFVFGDGVACVLGGAPPEPTALPEKMNLELACKPRFFRGAHLPEMHRIFLAGAFGMLLSVYGDVYTWGSATLGQLGLGFHVRAAARPTQILKANGFHAATITDDTRTMLANKDSASIFPPVRHLSVSPTHALAVSSENELGIWGQALVAADIARPLRRGIGVPVAIHHELWSEALSTAKMGPGSGRTFGSTGNTTNNKNTTSRRGGPGVVEKILGCCCGTQGGVVYTNNYVLSFQKFQAATFSAEQPDRTHLVPQLSYVTGFPQAATVEELFLTYSTQEWMWGARMSKKHPAAPDRLRVMDGSRAKGKGPRGGVVNNYASSKGGARAGGPGTASAADTLFGHTSRRENRSDKSGVSALRGAMLMSDDIEVTAGPVGATRVVSKSKNPRAPPPKIKKSETRSESKNAGFTMASKSSAAPSDGAFGDYML
ncbi:unnamed protein product [Amoebophrya sp. A120]|nr:unnamed protein product [Amoebophrya sp. A120]|eukprot:GSA120T00011602001.1